MFILQIIVISEADAVTNLLMTSMPPSCATLRSKTATSAMTTDYQIDLLLNYCLGRMSLKGKSSTRERARKPFNSIE